MDTLVLVFSLFSFLFFFWVLFHLYLSTEKKKRPKWRNLINWQGRGRAAVQPVSPASQTRRNTKSEWTNGKYIIIKMAMR
jgi:hypothetical protein